ncbi:hypothetical protein OCAE111667_19765 [Occultella aeris]|uniref:Uncharacterized protein n=1 Tax=Occultella aeris TaxID=2761496 RepID=A0A7M4DJK6_9MICO|nr:hypothetical protein [Occultella aeris]VZO37226.1 hypothetical protein HALOF300_02313 [Occultella aeris]
MDALNDAVLTAGDAFWTWLVLPIVALLGLYFTVRTGVVQSPTLPQMFRTLTDQTRSSPRDRVPDLDGIEMLGGRALGDRTGPGDRDLRRPPELS